MYLVSHLINVSYSQFHKKYVNVKIWQLKLIAERMQIVYNFPILVVENTKNFRQFWKVKESK